MKQRRFSKPLSAESKLHFPAPAGFGVCIDEIAAVYGISRAEVLRRLVAYGILLTSPVALGVIPTEQRDEIESLASLANQIPGQTSIDL